MKRFLKVESFSQLGHDIPDRLLGSFKFRINAVMLDEESLQCGDFVFNISQLLIQQIVFLN